MKAMVLAAGLGTRLRPLTDNRPKALVEVNGRTLLEITLARLRAFDIRDVIVNVHHFADMVTDFLKANANFGMHIEISREDVLLDTGGGLKKAAHFFLDSGEASEEPFLLHNVDVLSAIDFRRMMKFHVEHDALATLAVQNRQTSRPLLFDQDGELTGRRTGSDGKIEMARIATNCEALAFSGIHVISPRMLSMMRGEGVFSIIPTYLDIAAKGEKILAFHADEYYWRDLGKPENIIQAELDITAGKYAIA